MVSTRGAISRIAFVWVLSVTAGCGSEAPAPTPEDCIAITASSTGRYSATANSGWFTAAWGLNIEPQLEKDRWQGLGIKLEQRNGVQLTEGTFDLAEGPKATKECSHCVYVAYDGSGDNFQLDFAHSGTLVIEELDRERGILVARLEKVLLRHLNQRALHVFEGLSDDRHCLYLDEARIDTRPASGQECLSADDCPNAQLQVCDPKTSQCADVQCSEGDLDCGPDAVCQIQDPFFDTGACFDACAPFSSGACQAGQDCVPTDYIGNEGICKFQGPGSPEPRTETGPGRDCEAHQVATGCSSGHVCATHSVYWHYDHCYRQCDYFGEDSGCDTGQCWLKLHNQKEVDTTYLCGRGDCHFGGFCRETEGSLSLDQPCDADKSAGHSCIADEQRHGVCQPEESGALICRRYCRIGEADCAAGQRCEQVVVEAGDRQKERSIDGLGICRD